MAGALAVGPRGAGGPTRRSAGRPTAVESPAGLRRHLAWHGCPPRLLLLPAFPLRRACAKGRGCWRRHLSSTRRTPLCCCCWRTFACGRDTQTRCAAAEAAAFAHVQQKHELQCEASQLLTRWLSLQRPRLLGTCWAPACFNQWPLPSLAALLCPAGAAGGKDRSGARLLPGAAGGGPHCSGARLPRRRPAERGGAVLPAGMLWGRERSLRGGCWVWWPLRVGWKWAPGGCSMSQAPDQITPHYTTPAQFAHTHTHRLGPPPQAHQLDKTLPLPQLGIAQMHVLQDNPQNAVSILESVLLEVPHWIDALQVGATHYPRTGEGVPLRSRGNPFLPRAGATRLRLEVVLLQRCAEVQLRCSTQVRAPHVLINRVHVIFGRPPRLRCTPIAPSLSQVIGRVLPRTAQKSTKAVPQLKEAAAQRPKDAELWELLGDVLSAIEPAGGCRLRVRRGVTGADSRPARNPVPLRTSCTANPPRRCLLLPPPLVRPRRPQGLRQSHRDPAGSGRQRQRRRRRRRAAPALPPAQQRGGDAPARPQLWGCVQADGGGPGGELAGSGGPERRRAGALRVHSEVLQLRQLPALLPSPPWGAPGGSLLAVTQVSAPLRAHRTPALDKPRMSSASACGAHVPPLSNPAYLARPPCLRRQVTLAYNMARVKEDCGDLKAAEAEYLKLLENVPDYGDCCLRLACVAKARGDTKVRGAGVVACQPQQAPAALLVLRRCWRDRHEL